MDVRTQLVDIEDKKKATVVLLQMNNEDYDADQGTITTTTTFLTVILTNFCI